MTFTTIMARTMLVTCAVSGMFPALGAEAIQAGAQIDYGPHALFPDRWKQLGQDTKLHPWVGRDVVVLTTRADLDGATMGAFLSQLDAGWRHYARTTGQSPAARGLVDGKPTIAAVPDGRLTCGLGCGAIGVTGVEVAGFYDHDYPLVQKTARAIPHLYFYEMGRNYYVFADRHSSFITGFAVFMRYSCMDAVGCEDVEPDLRTAIERAEATYAEGRVDFLRAFTMQGGLGEKEPRLEGFAGPSDQPVLYASAMLKLRRDHGGDAWTARFFRALMQCPATPATDRAGALAQSRSWLVAASVAARRDLCDTFVDRWRLPMGKACRDAMAAQDWASDTCDAGRIVAGLPADGTE
jgi:hypothetical protein